MSLGAEIALQRIAKARGEAGGRARLSLVSETGLASPCLDAVATVTRLARRPAAGLTHRPLAAFAPPIDIARAPADARRVMARRALIIDIGAAALAETLAMCRDLAGRAPEFLRVRGDAPAPEAYRTLFRDEQGGEAIFATEDAQVAARFDDLSPDAADYVDEYKALTLSSGFGPVSGLRYEKGGAAALIAPATALDAPDAAQINAALGEGRAVFDDKGAATLAIPLISRRGDAVDIVVGGLGAGEMVDAAALSGSVASSVAIDDAEVVSLSATPDEEVARIALRLNPAATATAMARASEIEITEVAVQAHRRRALWEDWDEADAQLKLEESW